MSTYKVIGIGERGKFFDENAYLDTINYISDPAHAAYCGGAGFNSIETAAEEMREVAEKNNKDSGKRVRHSVLSFAPNENVSPEQARDFAERIIQYYAPDYQIAYAVHNNTDDTHIHFVMNQIGYNGDRYRGKKLDYYNFITFMKDVTCLPVIPTRQ